MAGTFTRRGKGGMGLLALLWLCLTGMASAATVTSESGGVENGSFLWVVGAVGNGDTITFADAVRKIILGGTAESASEGLTITGREDAFPAELAALLGQYGIDVSGGTADFSGLTGEIDQQALLAALDALTLPTVVVDGGDEHRLINLTTNTGNAASLTGLTLQNGRQQFTSSDDDGSSGGGRADTSVFWFDEEAQGGGVRFAGPGDIANSALVNNTLKITAGNATAQNDVTGSSTNGYANANAHALGGGAYLADGGITSSFFQGNTASAYGGDAKGGDNAP